MNPSGSTLSNPDEILRSTRFERPINESKLGEAPTASSILAGYDAASLHPLANVNTGELDYLLLDDDKLNELEGSRGVLPSRGWGDEVCCASTFQNILNFPLPYLVD